MPGRSSASPLRDYSRALVDLLLDARSELDDRAYGVWIELGTEAFGHEAARLILGAALRARRDDQERAA